MIGVGRIYLGVCRLEKWQKYIARARNNGPKNKAAYLQHSAADRWYNKEITHFKWFCHLGT